MLERKHVELGAEMAERRTGGAGRDAPLDDDVGDDLLRLVFISCTIRCFQLKRAWPLTLRLIGGLTTEEIARAFLAPVATIQQRIVRAQRTLTEARVPFEVPRGADRAARISSVLDVIYLVFNEGYSATAGDDWVRPALCEEALRLARVLAGLVPDDSEVLGVVALLEIQASRIAARTTSDGEPILLMDQDRLRWDRLLIQRGLAALDQALSLTGALGPYTLQAAIAACHARARTAEETEWTRITALYDALAQLTPSPVVELNRAVAYSMAFGPAEGLAIIEPLREDAAMKSYHLLHAVRADFLFKLGRFGEAKEELQKAVAMVKNAKEKRMLGARLTEWELRSS